MIQIPSLPIKTYEQVREEYAKEIKASVEARHSLWKGLMLRDDWVLLAMERLKIYGNYWEVQDASQTD